MKRQFTPASATDKRRRLSEELDGYVAQSQQPAPCAYRNLAQAKEQLLQEVANYLRRVHAGDCAGTPVEEQMYLYEHLKRTIAEAKSYVSRQYLDPAVAQAHLMDFMQAEQLLDVARMAEVNQQTQFRSMHCLSPRSDGSGPHAAQMSQSRVAFPV
ncbi:hypothetical protein DIPPA_30964 [Diplonema papillatum]|nr:hypothetical protein DIPPA_30964 [Diplonema papillatum]